MAEAAAQGVADRYTASSVQNVAGKGVTGIVDGRQVFVGNHATFDAQFPHSETLHADVTAREAAGYTTLLVNVNDHVSGYLTAADSVRESSAAVVEALGKMGVQVAMLSGDNPGAARQVAAAVGITQTHAGLLPAQKLDLIHALGASQGPVAMVGDGINDTPALAAASVGVAMGGAGSAQAIDAADVVLMADNLAQLPFALRLARFARRLIAQNIGISFVTKVVFFALAIEGSGSLWLAIAADMGVSLLVTFNGMRALRSR
jgi:Cd2+/Zn2+-exporting ATPase